MTSHHEQILEQLRTHWFGWMLDVDESLWQMFVQGLALGLAMVVFLDQFPGESAVENPEEQQEESAATASNQRSIPTHDPRTSDLTTKKDTTQESSSNDTTTQTTATPMNRTVHSLADANNMSDGERALLQKMLSRRQEDGSWTPHQRLNYAVYAILWMVAFGILWFVYNDSRTDTNHLYVLLLHNFPREMRALGFRKD